MEIQDDLWDASCERSSEKRTPTNHHDDLWDASRLEEPTLLKYNVHTPLQKLPVETVKQLSKKTALPLTLMLFNLNGDMNVGMSIRSAVIYGCSDVYIVGKRRYDRRPEVGAKNYISLHRVPEVNPSFFLEQKLIPICVEQGGTSLEDFSFKPYFPTKLADGWKVCLIMGSESKGLPAELVKDLKAPVLSISQYGVMRSLNVSVATGIVLYEFCRQWRHSIVV